MSTSGIIEIHQLTKIFGKNRGRADPSKRAFVALKQLDLKVHAGERIAFIGPNGAGKSTTIKMLCGILTPSSGHASVAGLEPWTQRTKLAYEIGTVFGQRSQLWQHLSPQDSYQIIRHIYNINIDVYRSRLDHLTGLFNVEAIHRQPIQTLSLGERMKCELIASLLHQPKVLFLDEPTIGLDINAKVTVRQLIRELSQSFGTTIFLTSHDTADIEQVCKRVVVIDRGQLIQDSSLDNLRRQYIKKKLLRIISESKKPKLQLPDGANLIEQVDHQIQIAFNPKLITTGKLIENLLGQIDIKDLEIKDPPLEEIIGAIYDG